MFKQSIIWQIMYYHWVFINITFVKIKLALKAGRTKLIESGKVVERTSEKYEFTRPKKIEISSRGKYPPSLSSVAVWILLIGWGFRFPCLRSRFADPIKSRATVLDQGCAASRLRDLALIGVLAWIRDQSADGIARRRGNLPPVFGGELSFIGDAARLDWSPIDYTAKPDAFLACFGWNIAKCLCV